MIFVPSSAFARPNWWPVWRRWLIVLLLAFTLTLIITNGWRHPRYRPTCAPLTGELRIVGSRDLSELVDRWVGIFRREHPDVHVSAAMYGSGIAAGALAEGLADIAPMRRPLKLAEQSYLQQAGMVPQTISVTRRERRPVYFYIRRSAGGKPNPAAIEFARVALSQEGQQGSSNIPGGTMLGELFLAIP